MSASADLLTLPSPSVAAANAPGGVTEPHSLLKGVRICFLAGTLGQGGAEQQLFYMLSALRKMGARPHLLTLTQGEFWEERVATSGVPVEWVGQNSSRLARAIRVCKTIKRLNPQIIQSQHFYTNPYAGLAATLSRRGAVAAVRNDGLSEIQASGKMASWIGLRLARVVAANSRLGIRNLVRCGFSPRRFFLLPNVINTDSYPKPVGKSNRRAVILGVGRLVRQKRFDRFLKVFSHVHAQTGGNVEARIVGAGALADTLKAMVGELKLPTTAVRFEGNVADVRPFYAAADVLLLTSDHEGTPNVVMEAMASGLPVVSTDVGDVSELVKDGLSGFLVERENAAGAASAVESLLSSPGMRMGFGREGRRIIETQRSLKLLPEWLQHLYQRVLLWKDRPHELMRDAA
jgi:glycosyltransferase involved in cell wall biosynthesis